MDNQAFNDYMLQHSAERMVAQGYAQNVRVAKDWLENRQAEPTFLPCNTSFSECGAVKTLGRLCGHAYVIICARRAGYEAELPARVKAYYTPRFEKEVAWS